MANAASEYHAGGKYPLLVWDESPQWVQTTIIKTKDLDWLIEQFDEEARPMRSLDAYASAMVNFSLFSSKYRVAVRPVIEAVKWIRTSYPPGVVAVKQAIEAWARVPSHRMWLDTSLRMLDKESLGNAWLDLVQSFTSAYRLNTTEAGFDTMRKDTQARVLRAESLVAALGTICGEQAIFSLAPHHIHLASLTPSGTLFRDRGGVVLDATANLAQLQALRPDLKAVHLSVQDRGEIERYMHNVASLDRTSLKHSTLRLEQVLQHAKRTTRRWAAAQGILNPKVAVFTYKSEVRAVHEAWPKAAVGYFGNVRGYDFYFQEGYDAFITVGDPITNLGALALQWRVLKGVAPIKGTSEWQSYVDASAEGELAQSHGRSRDPQAKLGKGGRLHIHYGRKVPSGWDVETTSVDDLAFTTEPPKGDL
jgi:hypothetical protein